MDSIDSIVDKALDKSKLVVEEPKHVLVRSWFKTWKMFKYETSSEQEAYAKYNEVMDRLMQLSNVLVDSGGSKVYTIDIAPLFTTNVNFKYVVEIYWRDAQ